MSAPGPESIPTSADPRSKRPVKKRALTPVSAQAASVDALFAKPEQDIRIPNSSIPASQRPRLAPPPEIVTNVQGSSAGAGSGEFHVYKASRRREYERLRLMDEELKAEQAKTQFEQEKFERVARDEEKTRKNREKREKKKKAREKAKTTQQPPNPGPSIPAPNTNQDKITISGIKARVESSQEGVKETEPDDKAGPRHAQNTASITPAVAPQTTQVLVIHDDD